MTVIERRASPLSASIEFVRHTGRDFQRGNAQGVVTRDMDGVPSARLAEWATLRSGAAGQRDGQPAYRFGSLESPVIRVEQGFDTAIASWIAVTPPGTWLQLDLAVCRTDGRWTRPYTMAVWASGTDTLLRHSVRGQDDADARVATDTLQLRDPAVGAAIRYHLTLFTSDPAQTPRVSRIAVVTSASEGLRDGSTAADDGIAWGIELEVPQRSQRVGDPASAGWCSPTATSMVLAYWGCSIPVALAAAATYDHVYAGTGNWAFNTAWAGSLGFEAYVTRFASLR
nr:C39 family peptidase [Chloroflexota bacterium]